MVYVALRRVGFFVLFLFAFAMRAQGAESHKFVGQWRLDGPLWVGELQISNTHISLGSPECNNLNYTLLKHLAIADQGDIYVIDVAAPIDRCRHADQQKVIFHLKVKLGEPYDSMHIDICPSVEDLELFMQGKNRRCSGTMFGIKKSQSSR